MPHRAPSPTGSEFEYDISKALADADFLSDNDNDGFDFDDDAMPSGPVPKKPKVSREDLDAEKLFKGDDDEDSDDDETFIAAQQAASNRKGSNLKGKKTVKKGGGFQAMGELTGVPKFLCTYTFTHIREIQVLVHPFSKQLPAKALVSLPPFSGKRSPSSSMASMS